MRRIVGLFLCLVMLLALTACGGGETDTKTEKKTAQDAVAADGSIVFRSEETARLDTPAQTLDVQRVYDELEYVPQMFYGSYRLLGGDEAVERYCAEMDYVAYKTSYSEQLTAIPYRIEVGKYNMHHSICHVKDYNWMRAYFQVEGGHLLDLLCAYEIDGRTLTLRPLKDFNVDKETNTIQYEFSGETWRYDFTFEGCKLTLSQNGKSVTMQTGLAVSEDTPYFHVSHYRTAGSKVLNSIDKLYFHLNDEGEAFAYAENAAGEGMKSTAIKLEQNGRMTITTVDETGAASTEQLVYFYGYEDGIVLTDGTDVYFYNDDYSDHNRTDLRQYVGEEQGTKLDELDDSALKELETRKESLIDDLAAAFADAGIDVTVDRQTGELAMDAAVLFKSDSAALTSEGKELLDRFLAAYTEIVFSETYSGFVSRTMVEGHTAPLANSTYETGLPLSVERAEAVRDYCLSTQSRYSAQLAEMLEAVGMSNTSPILNEDGTPNLAASRRVVFRFLIDLDAAASN